MLALDKNLIMSGDLIHTLLMDNNGFVRLKHDSFVVDPDKAPMTIHGIIDNRVIASDDMTAIIPFKVVFIVTKDTEGENQDKECLLKVITPESDMATIGIELINWRGGAPILNLTTPVLVSSTMPLFNLSTKGQIFFSVVVKGCDTSNALFVDIDFWYGDPTNMPVEKPETETPIEPTVKTETKEPIEDASAIEPEQKPTLTEELALQD